MRRVSKGARLAIASALVASALCVVALGRLLDMPPVATRLPSGAWSDAGALRLTVSAPEGVLQIAADGAALVTPQLARVPIKWPEGVHIDALYGVAWADGVLDAVYRQGTNEGLLSIELAARKATATFDPQEVGLRYLGLRAVEDGFELYRIDRGVVRVVRFGTREGLPAAADAAWRVAPIAPHLHLDAVDGIVYRNDQPLLVVGERGAHWLVAFDGRLERMPENAISVWSASHMPSGAGHSARVPFLDGAGVAHAFASDMSWLAFTRELDGTLMALPVAHSYDEPGVIETVQHDRRLELRVQHRKLYASSPAHVGWRAVASISLPSELAAFPTGKGWIALSASGDEAVALDANGARVQPTSAADTVAALTGRPLSDWIALLGLVAVLLLLLPLVVWRTVAMLRLIDEPPPRPDQPGAAGVIIGTLRVPPGVVVHTDSAGRAALSGVCSLQAGGVTLELASRPLRFDGSATPLVDGDTVYAVGRVETDTAGGPMRASQRKRLQPLHGRYVIGRGGAADFARHLQTRANAGLVRFALVHLGLAATILGFLSMRV